MQKKSPLLSVIIPTYNRARFIAEAIDSVLAQTYTNFELIVVDDGSTDNTRQVLQPYMNRIRYIFQENAGCSTARNTGLKEAKGEWIAYLDSDDIWMPEKLQTQVEDVCSFPDVCAHSINTLIYRDHIGKEVDIFSFTGFNAEYRQERGFIERPLLPQIKFGFGWPQCMLTKKQILVKAGAFDNELRLWQDMDAFYRVAALGNWAYNSKPLVKILRREKENIELSSQSVRNRANSYREMIKLLNKVLQSENLFASEHKQLRRKLGIYYSCLGLEEIISKKRREALGSLKRGFQLKPSIKNAFKFTFLLLPAGLVAKIIKLRRRSK